MGQVEIYDFDVHGEQLNKAFDLTFVVRIYAADLPQRVGNVFPRFDPLVVFRVRIVELGEKAEALEHLLFR